MEANHKTKLSQKEKTEILLEFINSKVLYPIINASPLKYTGDNIGKLEEVQKKTHKEQEQFHQLNNPADIKQNYLDNVNSHWSEKVNNQLQDLGLPTLPEHKEEFIKLCKELEV